MGAGTGKLGGGSDGEVMVVWGRIVGDGRVEGLILRACGGVWGGVSLVRREFEPRWNCAKTRESWLDTASAKRESDECCGWRIANVYDLYPFLRCSRQWIGKMSSDLL